jgi:peptide-methionine (S)-S-oxide reductase
MTDHATPSPSAEIVLGGGCFWCTEAVFDRVEGVLDVVSGYANGHVPSPTYEDVCTGRSGHVEVIRVRYDPARVTLEELLEIFFAVHDPTTPDRQGNDEGPQYRSGIYASDADSLERAGAVVAALRAQGVPAVTEVRPLASWWPAEDYHQDYFLRHPQQGYCAFVVAPKVRKLHEAFAARVRRGAD